MQCCNNHNMKKKKKIKKHNLTKGINFMIYLVDFTLDLFFEPKHGLRLFSNIMLALVGV